MSFFSTLIRKPQAWLLLAASALGLEFCALYFQYVLDLKPCIMCIYQRVAIAAILLAGLLGATTCRWRLGQIVATSVWGIGAIWGLLLAVEHVNIIAQAQNPDPMDSLFMSCEFIPNFPTWAPLHEWIPSIFSATGDCGEISWSFLGYNMPQWMIVVYGVYTAVFALIALVVLSGVRKKAQ